MDRKMLPKVIVFMALIVSLLGLTAAVSAAPPEVPPAQPSPRPPAFDGQPEKDGGKERSEPDIHSDLWGTVTDLSTGRPGQGMSVLINGTTVRTDSSGRFSLTGLPAGEYVLRLELPGGMTAAQSQWRMQLDGQTAAAVELEYFSQPAPTVTPAVTETPAPVVVLPRTGGTSYAGLGLIFGLILCGLGIFLTLSARKGKTTS